MINTVLFVASSSNGRTRHSGCWYLGSNPGEAAIKKPPKRRFFYGCFILGGEPTSESKYHSVLWNDDEIAEGESRSNPGEAAIKKPLLMTAEVK